MSVVDGILDSLEAKYHDLVAKIKEKKAEQEMKEEISKFEEIWQEFKESSQEKGKELKKDLIAAWKALEEKYQELKD